MWTYYRQDYVNGIWMLFRRKDTGRQEWYRRGEGWTRSNELFVRESKGEIDRDDVVDEQVAFDLIRGIGEDPARLSAEDGLAG